jgi:hypothetical protein
MKPPEARSGQICGPVTALTAPARKPAVIIRDMLVKIKPTPPPLLTFFLEEKRKLKPVDWVKKQVATFGLKQEDLGFATP